MIARRGCARLIALAAALASARAWAEPVDTQPGDVDAGARAAAGEGLGQVQAVPHGAGSVLVDLGFDGAREGTLGTVAGEAEVAGRVYAIGGAIGEAGTWRPYAGAKLVLARELAVSVAYKAEGFTEPEGELEVAVIGGHRFGRAYLLGDGIYGQDLDGRDRDGELAAALAVPAGPIVASTSARARFTLGAMPELGASWDALADVGATLPLGRYAARAAVGVSAVAASRLEVGPQASLAVAAYF